MVERKRRVRFSDMFDTSKKKRPQEIRPRAAAFFEGYVSKRLARSLAR